MKKGNQLQGTIPLLMAAVLCAFTPGLPAQGSNNQDQSQQQQEQQSKTFTGKILKLQDGKYALVTGQTTDGHLSGHFLDNQDEAKKYDGKQVKVTGTLEAANNTIHVTKIEAA
ncbi:DUF5818 domain-containing protein [Alloacidobacterium sp.]|uniref:DUF5818 domain-containing protein n=1 Tax=Alloacidobacterium sp. TaxID=2951999 RepID=UPI002D552EAC|nr:DUF5818 domain-containing protein [Alloacidobacterium sp.]HYK35878.1 DUF5818 domain-containing protein [Alloacidobacterium sp.]